MKILIIDDDRDILMLLAEHLEDGGHEVDYADSGHKGLPIALEGRFDLIILDRQLPGNIDGLRLLEILRAEDNQASVLILSGRSRVVDHIEGFRAGTDDYLAKPFTLKELDASIAAIAAQRASLHGALPAHDTTQAQPVRPHAHKAPSHPPVAT